MLAYFAVLTIVHLDSTSILSLYNIPIVTACYMYAAAAASAFNYRGLTSLISKGNAVVG
jgi:hypothetical protein